MSEHKRTITAISWCPGNPDLFASASADNLLIIWNVAEQRTVARLDNTKGQQRSSGGAHRAPEGFDFRRSSLHPQASPPRSAGAGTRPMGWRLCPSVARYTSGSTAAPTPGSPSIKRPTRSSQTSASSGGTPTKKGNWCLDTRMGVCLYFSQVGPQLLESCLSFEFLNLTEVCCPGSKSQKHVLRPESLEGTDEEDPVSALEWDLLSTDYLLGCDPADIRALRRCVCHPSVTF